MAKKFWWIEMYQPCGCTFVAKNRADLMGYCSRHGGDVSKHTISRLPAAELTEKDLGIS